ncbi:hypothetical protein HPB51_025455 [Rhipicephalus microplus]|uniref:Uncharacterized protein n=1 Tax=Rhipicephalus microplus TaxID=6941 RepID=A0A9J6DRP4_RHIMP|nr:hypothetical protein HPB51_025455 [Rhipicephalus microplus]
MASHDNNDNEPPAFRIPWQPYFQPTFFAGHGAEDVVLCLRSYQRHCRTLLTRKSRRITPKFGSLPNVTNVTSLDLHPTPSDLASIIRQVVHEELDLREVASLPVPNVREPSAPCDLSATTINAASLDAYNYTPRPRGPSRTMRPYYSLDHTYARRPPTGYQAWNGRAIHRSVDISAPGERPISFNCGIRGNIARFRPDRHRTAAPSDGRPRSFYGRSNQHVVETP